MTAPFAADLCGYRGPRLFPSTSDAHDANSIAWGRALFAALGVSDDAMAAPDVGRQVESLTRLELVKARPDLDVASSRAINQYQQYSHLAAFSRFQGRYRSAGDELQKAVDALQTLPPSGQKEAALRSIQQAKDGTKERQAAVDELVSTMAQESMLRLDIAVGSPMEPSRLLLALSCKWSLRTDRAQDCIAQGNKLVSHRRGPMPHYAVLTMEPRPAMLRLLAYGSGAVDCIYHLALPELQAAAKSLVAEGGHTSVRQKESLDIMIRQGRLQPFGALLDEMMRLPK